MPTRAKLAVVVALLTSGVAAAVWHRKPNRPAATPVSETPPAPPASNLVLRAGDATIGAGWDTGPVATPSVEEKGSASSNQPLAAIALPSGPAEATVHPRVTLLWDPDQQNESASQPVETTFRNRLQSSDTLSSLAEPHAGPTETASTPLAFGSAVPSSSPARNVSQGIVSTDGERPPSASQPAAEFRSILDRPPEPSSAASPTASSAPPALAPPAAANPAAQGPWRASTPARSGQRTYTVRPEDTLASIALQFFGDPRRYPELITANPTVLRAPEDLRVGLVLVIP